jgi:hypothetical protein
MLNLNSLEGRTKAAHFGDMKKFLQDRHVSMKDVVEMEEDREVPFQEYFLCSTYAFHV